MCVYPGINVETLQCNVSVSRLWLTSIGWGYLVSVWFGTLLMGVVGAVCVVLGIMGDVAMLRLYIVGHFAIMFFVLGGFTLHP